MVFADGLFLDPESGGYREGDLRADDGIVTETGTGLAEIVGLPGKLGTLAPGAFADLVVLARDPLGDIGALADPAAIRYVVKGGAIELANLG
jgi:imidazolonepropionase-like amidohydrolase